MEIVLAVLIAQLGADDFRARERAHAALARIGPAAHIHLHLAEKSKDHERAARAKQILDRWYAEHAEQIAGPGPWPWLAEYSCYYDYLESARLKMVAQGPPDWADWREATRLLVVDMVRRRADRSAINMLLKDFWRAEADWKAQHQR